MERAQLNYPLNFDNVLYIGDEPKACLSVIEDFNNRLNAIEFMYGDWFISRNAKNRPAVQDKLQYHIHYNFEGGVAVFKFKYDDDLPLYIRKEIFAACKDLADEQLYYAS